MQRRIAAVAAEQAVEGAEVDDERVAVAVGRLRTGDADPAVRDELRKAVEELDERGFDLADTLDYKGHGDNAAAYGKVFSQARAANAVLAALDRNTETAALEALYEAIAALDGDLTKLEREIAAIQP